MSLGGACRRGEVNCLLRAHKPMKNLWIFIGLSLLAIIIGVRVFILFGH